MAGECLLPEGDVELFRGFFPAKDADRLMEALGKTVAWKQEKIKLYGKESPVPRLTAWYGDPGTGYKYSGIAMDPLPWTPELREIKEKIEPASGSTFNSVLLNLYRNGSDSVSWHADDEKSLGPETVIASVSLGATRAFQFKKRRGSEKFEVELQNGDLLVMKGKVQKEWLHQIPKTKKPVGPRINLTFRKVARPTTRGA